MCVCGWVGGCVGGSDVIDFPVRHWLPSGIVALTRSVTAGHRPTDQPEFSVCSSQLETCG